MAAFVLTNEFLLLNAVDLSNKIRSADLTLDVDIQDGTVMGDTWKDNLPGLKGAKLDINFVDDFAAGSLDSTIFSIFGTTVAFEVRPDAGARSTSNPGYTGNCIVGGHAVGGEVGNTAMKKVPCTVTGAVARQTA